ncbi:IS4 family transposase [Spirochaetia bacterium]|nr:IS4 family transposase [Spirochaetia bacterium]
MENTVEFEAHSEFEGINFNEKRLEKRFIRTMKTLSRKPDQSIWTCSESHAEAKAIYRMLGNKAFDIKEVSKTHRNATINRIKNSNQVILALQDTTVVNYRGHISNDEIGYCTEKSKGIRLHTCLAVSTDGVVIGVLDQSQESRAVKSHAPEERRERKKRPVEEKESYRWLETIRRSNEGIPSNIKVINVCDREGDMYELFEEAEATGKIYLIRVKHNRRTANNKMTLDSIKKKYVSGEITVDIPRDSRGGNKARQAVLEVSFGSFDIRKPKIFVSNKKIKESVNMNIIYVKEKRKTKGSEQTEWILSTNESINTFDKAYKMVAYYIQRWKIEQFHYVLKSGCTIEKIQERTLDKITMLIYMYSIIAAKIMNITYLARVNPDISCTVIFEENEWKILYRAANRKTEAPDKPYTMKEAVEYLSCLGGPKRAPSHGPPGLKTIWLGLNALHVLIVYSEALL